MIGSPIFGNPHHNMRVLSGFCGVLKLLALPHGQVAGMLAPSFILGTIIPKSVKCIHSATKFR